MNKNGWNGLKRFLTILGDIALYNISIRLAFYWKFGQLIPERNLVTYEQSALLISVVFLLINFLLGAYVFYNRRISDIIFITVLGQLLTTLGITIISFMGRYFAFPRSVIGYSFVLGVVILGIWRIIVYYLYLHFTDNRKVAVVAYAEELPAILDNFSSNKNNKHKIAYAITDHFLDNVEKTINDVDIFYITQDISDEDRRAITDLAIKNGKGIFVPSTFENILMLRPNMLNFEDESVMELSQFRLTPENAFFKRLFDIIVGLVMLVIASPFMLITAILVKLTSPGPIIYKQTRITLNQKEFHIYKFRTMTANAEAKSGPMLAQANDSRITPVGKYLRKVRLDELPQIFNVLKGDMSIVGPRPERPFFVDQFNQEDPYYYLRHNVRAGITGYAQVYGKYASDYHSKLKFDMLYIKVYSLTLDAKILLQTIRILFDKVSSQGLDEDERPNGRKLKAIIDEQNIRHLK